MAHFQIYIPGKPLQAVAAEPMDEMFARVGLQGMEAGADISQCTGPDGNPGRVFSWVDPRKVRVGYQPEKQDWIQSHRGYWVGFWKDDPPRELELLRPDARGGSRIQLNDETWLIATLSKLDRFAHLNPETGELTWCVDEEFNWLVHTLDKRKEEGVLESDGTVTILFDDTNDFHFFCRVLAINYRITPEVICHLKLLSQQTIRRLVAGMMGLSLKDD